MPVTGERDEPLDVGAAGGGFTGFGLRKLNWMMRDVYFEHDVNHVSMMLQARNRLALFSSILNPIFHKRSAYIMYLNLSRLP